jgi:predicted DsbA family dithiol-disulfide isomerase
MNGETFDSYCNRRWGGSAWTNHLKIEGSKDQCSFANWKYWPNTLRAHQLIQYGMENFQTDTDFMNSALFHALYEEGENISSIDTLVSMGVEWFCSHANFDANHLRHYLQDDHGGSLVHQEIAMLRRTFQVKSVPSFQIGIVHPHDEFRVQHSLSGAQSSQSFTQVFQMLLEE